MLKFRPKKFWGMLKSQHTQDGGIPTAAIMEYNKRIFYDESIPEDEYTPPSNRT
jgi:hypothetical protein